jgi:hypothetical protein
MKGFESKQDFSKESKLAPEDIQKSQHKKEIISEDDLKEIYKINPDFPSEKIIGMEGLTKWIFYGHLNEYFGKNPPINRSFSPEEELKKIRKLPKEEKEKELAVFKELLAKQQMAWANCKSTIEAILLTFPDFPKRILREIIEKYGEAYGFTEEQKTNAEKVLDKYFEQRKKAIEIRKQIQDDYQLVERLTGVKLNKNEVSHLKISVGPMAINIYADPLTALRLFTKGKESTDKDVPFSGFARASKENNIFYTVIVDTGYSRDYELSHTIEHEQEHLSHALFEEIFDSSFLPRVIKDYDEQDPEIKRVILEDFFNQHRSFALRRVKGEIFAYLRGSGLEYLKENFKELFFKTRNEGGGYDYLANLREWKDFENDSIYQELCQKMLVEEYQLIIKI